MKVGSFEFFAFVAAVVAACHLYRSASYRLAVVTAASFLFMATWIETPAQALLIAGVVLAGFVMLRLTQSGWIRGPIPGLLYGAGLLAIFMTSHRATTSLAGTAAPTVSVPLLVGYSYLMLKQIHMLVDAQGGRLQPVTFLAYLGYTCGFYTWLSGPIQRYDDFAVQVRGQGDPTSAETMLLAIDRILDGCFKALLIAPWLARQSILPPQLEGTETLRFWGHIAAFYFGFYVYLYLDFSGYCDIVIGAAALTGLRLPENFRQPFLARNLLDFWQRWHITLSMWLRDYVFTFTYASLLRTWPAMATACATAAYLVTFDLVGVWHGVSVNFVLYGLMQGIGTAFNHLGHVALTRFLSRNARRRYERNPLIRVVAIVVCQCYVALAMLVFAYPLPSLRGVCMMVWRRLLS